MAITLEIMDAAFRSDTCISFRPEVRILSGPPEVCGPFQKTYELEPYAVAHWREQLLSDFRFIVRRFPASGIFHEDDLRDLCFILDRHVLHTTYYFVENCGLFPWDVLAHGKFEFFIRIDSYGSNFAYTLMVKAPGAVRQIHIYEQQF